jgi:uncharacterized membrane protein YraQ (UPF0718 family)
MFARIFRVLMGFVMACLAAGLTKVLFAFTPAEISALPADLASDRMAQVWDKTLGLATHTAVFSAPFALVAAAIGEWRRIRDVTYYVLAGLAIAGVGLMAQYTSEVGNQPSILNNYALTAFLATGFFGGLAYWLFSGRAAGTPLHRHGMTPGTGTGQGALHVRNGNDGPTNSKPLRA